MPKSSFHQSWVNWRDEKVWCVGYDRDYVPDSAEVRTVVIKKHKEQLLIVCEHEISPWMEKRVTATHPMEALNGIFNIATMALNFNDCQHPKTAEYRLQLIRSLASRGLGLTINEPDMCGND